MRLIFRSVLFCLLLLGLAPFPLHAQVERGALVPNLAFEKFINGNESVKSFGEIKDSLLIVDFFATWCVPCLQALPKLEEVQQKAAGRLKIILSSQEEEKVLNTFIGKRKSWPFTVVVDKEKKWNNFFKPPSLPFTVVVKNGVVIDIVKAEEITSQKMQDWYLFSQEKKQASPVELDEEMTVAESITSGNYLVALSQQYVYKAKTGATLQEIEPLLQKTTVHQLVDSLNTDVEKKAFWINIYNGYVQAALRSNPGAYNKRSAFFKQQAIAFADKTFSPDEIEHDILRRSSVKWSLGYLRKPFPSKLKKAMRVNELDNRIHFALNCGAKSCPPIAYYSDNKIDNQLTQAANAYLTGEVEYDSANGILKLPAILGWFRGDFGGKKGIVRMLENKKLIPENRKLKIQFKPYDWTLHLANPE